MKWIDVKDAKPNDGDRVLVWNDYYGDTEAEIVVYSAPGEPVCGESTPEDWYIGDGYSANGVTHWMPLPASPAEEVRYTLTPLGAAMLEGKKNG